MEFLTDLQKEGRDRKNTSLHAAHGHLVQARHSQPVNTITNFTRRIVLSSTTVDDGLCAHFMDLDIHRPGPRMPLATDIYDRRSEPQFVERVTPVRLPFPDSMLWVSVGRNVLEGQMTRFSRLCTYAGYFAHRTAVYVRDMINVGYPTRRLWGTVERRAPAFAWRYGLSPNRLFLLIREHFRDLPGVGGCS